MSKYFDELQRAEEWSLQQAKAMREAASTLVESAPAPELVTPNPPKPHDQRRPLIRLEVPPESPIVFGAKESYHHATEAYRTLRTRLLRLQASKGFRSIAVSSATPGEGKTVTTLNLGLCCAQLHDTPILLIDADLRKAELSRLLGRPAGAGLAEILGGKASFQDSIIPTENPNLFVMPAGTPETPAPELLASETWKELMAWCGETFRLTLIDTPPARPLADFELVSAACDGYLMVVRARQTERDALKGVATHLDAKKLVGVVFNSADTLAKASYGATYAAYGQESALSLE